MKRFTLLTAILSLVVITRTNAQTISADTVYGDLVTSNGVTADASALGRPDGKEAQLTLNSEMWIQLGLGDSTAVTFQSGATIEIHWTKFNVTDSEAAFMQFVELSPKGFEVRKDTTNYIINKPGVMTVTVPGPGYN